MEDRNIENLDVHPPTPQESLLAEIIDAVAKAAPDGLVSAGMGVDMPVVVAKLDSVVEVCRLLRDNASFQFALLSDLTAVDHLGREPRFDVVYHLYSYQRQTYVRVKVGVPEVPCVCPTMTEVWPGANWLEREVWDMFGIDFQGHPGLNRILTPEGWEYFALRRDFPLQGPGMVKLYDKVTDIF